MENLHLKAVQKAALSLIQNDLRFYEEMRNSVKMWQNEYSVIYEFLYE